MITETTDRAEIARMLDSVYAAREAGRIGGPAVDDKIDNLRLRLVRAQLADEEMRYRLAALRPAICTACGMGTQVFDHIAYGDQVTCTLCDHREFRTTGD